MEHKIRSQQMELTFTDESKANAVYNVMLDLCYSDVQYALEKSFDEFSSLGKIVCIKKLDVNLGTVDYSVLPTQLPRLILEGMRKALSEIVLNNEDGDIEMRSSDELAAESIACFLEYGFLPWNARQQDIALLVKEYLQASANDFASLIRTKGRSRQVRVRLTERFNSLTLQRIVAVLEPQYAYIIIDYHKHLVMVNTKETIVRTPQTVLEKVLWLFVFNHLLVEQGSVFNTRSFTISMLRQFSCHFNIAFRDLIVLLKTGFTRWEGSLPPFFIDLLEEINAGAVSSAPRHSRPVLTDRSSVTLMDRQALLRQLMDHGFFAIDTAENKKIWNVLLSTIPEQLIATLKRLQDKEQIIQLVFRGKSMGLAEKLVVAMEPGDAETIIDCHKNVVAIHRKESFVNSSLIDFERNLWTFMIVNLLDNHGSYFNQKSFLKSVISVMAVHYTIDEYELLHTLCSSAQLLPSRLSRAGSFFRCINELFDETKIIGKDVTVPVSKNTSTKQHGVSAVEQAFLKWKQGHTGHSGEQLVQRFLLKDPVRFIHVLRKYITYGAVREQLVKLDENAFSELVTHLVPTSSLSVVLQALVLFDQMMARMLIYFGSERNYRHAVRLAFLETLAAIQSSGVISDRDLIKLMLQNFSRYGNSLRIDQVFHYAEMQHGLLTPLIKKIVKELQQEKILPADTGTVIEDMVQWLVHSTVGDPVPHLLSGFSSYYEIIQFVYAHHPEVLLHVLAKQSVSHTQQFIHRLSDRDLDALSNAACSIRTTWYFSLLMDWGAHLAGFCKHKEICMELKRIMLLGHIHMLPSTNETFIRLIIQIFNTYDVPDSFFENVLRWSLPAHGDAALAILKIEQNVLDSGRRITGVETEKARIKILKETMVHHRKKNEEARVAVRTDLTEGLYIANAGLVLLNPYITFLFEQCGLLKNGKFKTPVKAARAVAMLHYAVVGSEMYKEEDHVLNKVLCGLALNSVSKRITLTRKERTMVSGMLNALTEHWQSISKSKEDDVRGNWLVRDGKLTETEAHWELTVKRSAYDLLLDSLPFTLSPIKYPWMKKMIIVQWL